MNRTAPRLLPCLCLLALLGGPAAVALGQWSPPGADADAVRADDVTQLRHLTFEQRTEFVAAVRAAAGRLDRRIATLAAARGAATLPAVTQALTSARQELEASIRRVDEAGRQHWEAARDEVLAELAEAQAAFERAAMSS